MEQSLRRGYTVDLSPRLLTRQAVSLGWDAPSVDRGVARD